ncbi:MAG: ribonuclease III [Arenicellales bacterium]|jgi:ribonuclease-3|nr:ribonuclease III [Arenicellales bacterium]
MALAENHLQKRIGYRFNDPELLTRALTHRSLHSKHNERLEFLGDSVLGLAVAQSVFLHFPLEEEGHLTRIRARLVNKGTLARIARRFNLGDSLHLGESAARSGGADRASILADALEALIGAVFLEAGFEQAAAVVAVLLVEEFADLGSGLAVKDAKTALQEHLQKNGLPLPCYRVMRQIGEPHRPEFQVECVVAGADHAYSGRGESRKAAEQAAAHNAYTDLCGKSTANEC